MTRRQSIQQVEAMRNRYENTFYAPVSKALQRQISSFTDILKTQGAQSALSAVVIDTSMAPVIQKLYTTVGVARASQVLSNLRRLPKRQAKRRTLGFNLEWTRQILEYFELNLFNKVVLPISETTQRYIRDVINEGLINGDSIEEMVHKIERHDYLDGRVRRILRTEINRAINYGTIIGEQKFEYKTMKRWTAAHDSRTRHPHLLADGQTVQTDGTYLVGGEVMEFPGDPNASAANTVNCRCHSEIIAQRDVNGRLIPKEQNPQPEVRVRGRLRNVLREALAELTS